jgi:hypothetical protein
MKKLREIARTHIEKAAAGDMQAIKELADRLDGKPAQMLEHSGPDSEPITKVVNEIVHVYETREQIEFNDQTPLLEINPSKNGGNTTNGVLKNSGKSHFLAGLVVEDTARTKR